jgi:hypothetical protein
VQLLWWCSSVWPEHKQGFKRTHKVLDGDTRADIAARTSGLSLQELSCTYQEASACLRPSTGTVRSEVVVVLLLLLLLLLQEPELPELPAAPNQAAEEELGLPAVAQKS